MADDALPRASPPDRYKILKTNCPFAISSPVAPAGPALPSFAANWYVNGIASFGDSAFVSIKARDLSVQISLFGSEADAKSGVSLVGIDWVEGIGKSVVTIRKGSEIAKLEFNEAVIHGPAQNVGGQMNSQLNRGVAVAVVAPTPTVLSSRPVPGIKDQGRPFGNLPANAHVKPEVQQNANFAGRTTGALPTSPRLPYVPRGQSTR